MRFVFVLISLFLLSKTAFSQVDKSRHYLSLGYGILPSNSHSLDIFKAGNISSMKPISLYFEMPLGRYIDSKYMENVTAGVQLSYSRTQSALELLASIKYKYTFTSILFRASYHLDSGIGLIPYFGFTLGRTSVVAKVESKILNQSVTKSVNASGAYFGVGYGIGSRFKAFAELSSSISILTIGGTLVL